FLVFIATFLFYQYSDTRHLPSFPTRRSSDLQGFVVFRNLELTAAFAPVEHPADFGLDALYIVTDAIPPAPAPRIDSIRRASSSGDRKSTRLNSSHVSISYAVFCLKKEIIQSI